MNRRERSEKDIQQSNKQVESKIFQTVYFNFYPGVFETLSFGPEYEEEAFDPSINWVFYEKKEYDFVKSILPFVGFDIEKIVFRVLKKDKHISNFLKSSFIHKIDELIFSSSRYSMLPFSFILIK
ncbi:unnamed protein product [Moneuplotes crassus]|uniref:Uncharacterized protein n=1 Tax=Euplotes crassus TaxID=5936 RepID=A0AAD1UI49_EUPCR|nr:unnamed protein product [Moneuplotes crassus]